MTDESTVGRRNMVSVHGTDLKAALHVVECLLNGPCCCIVVVEGMTLASCKVELEDVGIHPTEFHINLVEVARQAEFPLGSEK